MNLSEHITNAVRQFRNGENVGRLGTPVISIWDMRPKWEKWGNAWEYIGSDGPLRKEEGKLLCPALLQLVYLRTYEGKVLQLAYEIRAEVFGAGSQKMESAIKEFESLTAKYPRQIA